MQIANFIAIYGLEITAAVTGLINVYLIARTSMWNWLFGIISVSLYLVIFYEVKLYADMGLQAIYLGFQFYGIYQWSYGGNNHSSLAITRANNKICLQAFFATCVIFLGLVGLLEFTDSTTVYADAFITALSLTAQWMLSKKWLQQWAIWIVADTISIGLYLTKALYFTAILYVILVMLAIKGHYMWKNYAFGKVTPTCP